MPVPFNLEAEEAVLGSVLNDPNSILRVLADLKSSQFYGQNTAMVYEAMVRIAERHCPIDLVTLTAELAGQERIERVGGRDYLDGLRANCENIEHYAEIIKQAWVRRNLATSATEIMGWAYDTTLDADDVTSKARESLLRVGSTRRNSGATVEEIGEKELPRIQRKFENPDETWGLSTGIHVLDNALGGLEKRDNIVIAGRPGSGKSALADTIAVNVAKRGKRVVLFTLEMSKEIRADRMACIYGGFDFTEFRRGYRKTPNGWRHWSDDEQVNYYQKRFAFDHLPIIINDTASITTAQIESVVGEVMLKQPVDLVIGDYMGLMGDALGAKRYEQVGTISRGIKRVAMALGVPFLNLAQLNRQCEERADKKPELADLRDSGDVEQDADVVILIWRPAMYWKDSLEWHKVFPKDSYPGENLAELNVAKFRNGETGFVKVAFDAPRMRFMDLENYHVQR